MKSLDKKLNALGVAQGQRNAAFEQLKFTNTLPKLALEVAKAAKSREIDESDAVDVYLAYYKAASKLKTIDPYSTSVRVQISKLRQIIKARDPDLITRALRTRAALYDRGVIVRQAYYVIVDACRLQVKQGRKITKDQLINVAKRKG